MEEDAPEDIEAEDEEEHKTRNGQSVGLDPLLPSAVDDIGDVRQPGGEHERISSQIFPRQ